MSIFDGLGFFKSFSRDNSKLVSKRAVVVGEATAVPQTALKNSLTAAAKQTYAVRKREFDRLRALRLHMAAGEVRGQYFSQTSIHSRIEDRASTIKKIDEIEAQMSMQWWKTDRLDLTKKS